MTSGKEAREKVPVLLWIDDSAPNYSPTIQYVRWFLPSTKQISTRESPTNVGGRSEMIRFVFDTEAFFFFRVPSDSGLTCARRATGSSACARAPRGYPTLSLPSVMIDFDAFDRIHPEFHANERGRLTHGIWSSESLGLLAGALRWGAVKHHSRPHRVAPSPRWQRGLQCMRSYHTYCNLFGFFFGLFH